MIRTISFTQQNNKKVKSTAIKPFTTVSIKGLKADTLTFSSNIPPKSGILATEAEISTRIKAYKKAFNDQSLPTDLLKVLTDPRVPMTIPDETIKSTVTDTQQTAISKGFEWLQSAVLPNKSVNALTNVDDKNYKVLSLRLNELKILDKSEGIFKGNGECYFLSMVTDGVNEPVVLKVATFKDIKNGDDLFDKGLQKPFTIYLSNDGQFPRFIDFRFAVIEDDTDQSRTANEIIKMVQNDEVYKKIMSGIKSLINAGRPQEEISPLLDSALTVAKKILDATEDDLLIYHVDRFNANNGLGIGQHSSKNHYVKLGYEIVAK